MSSFRAVRALWVLGTSAGLLLAGPGIAQATAAVTAGIPPAVASPTPIPLPAADSWVGGQNLIDSRLQANLPAGVPVPPAPKAASWLIADLDTRQILAGRRMHVPLAPASTLKIFTALALAHRLDPAALYTGRNDDAAVDGTKVGIVPGSVYTVNDLLHGMLMSSGNDCANALGNKVGGKATAVGLIQQEAQSLGAFDTVARTTNGLDAKGQVSSAYDLALAGSAALNQPQLTSVLQTKVYRFPAAGKTLSPKRKRFEIQSHDHLLWNYRGATGIKNGYTVAARGSFVGSATRNGHSYLAVVMRAEGATWKEAAALLDWAFVNGAKATGVGTLVQPGELTAKVGPGLPDIGIGTVSPSGSATPGATGTATDPASTAAGSAADIGTGTPDSLRGAALPASQATLTSALSSATRRYELWIGAGLLGLLLLALAAGRRSLIRRPVPGTGKHRG